MRAYLIDEISASDMENVNGFLKEHAVPSNLEKISWVQVPEDLLSDIQLQHQDCRPHVFAIELGSGWVKLEFFVRSLKNMQCRCPGYCTPQQRDYVMQFAHDMLAQLDIKT